MPALLGRVVGRQVPIGRLLGWQLYCHPWGDSTTIAPTKALLGRSLSAAISGCFMLWLGLLSVVQVAFLPGYLVLCALRLAVRPGQTLVLSFALSLVLNHFLVLALVLLGCYKAGVMYAIFALEAALFAWTARKWPQLTVGEVIGAAEGDSPIFVDTKIGTVPENRGGASPAQAVIAGAAVLLMIGFAVHGLFHAGDIFREWDAVVSWNRWALDWAANGLPHTTAEYPQLLPCNLSLTYVFIQDNSIWFFAKGLMFLFCLFLLLGMFDLYRQTGKVGYALGVLVTYGLFVALLRFRFINSGYADMPVATLAFAGVYALLLARGATTTAAQWKYIFIGGVICAGAALTKQAGLFIAAVYLLLAWLLVERARRWAPMLLLAALMLAMITPWYVYKQIAISRGQEHTLTAYLLNDIHAGRNLWQRLIHAGGLLREALSLPGMLLVAAAVAFAMRDGVQRRLVLLVAIPFSLVWALGFSYDLRNIALAVPLVGAAAGIGVVRVVEAFALNRKRTAGLAPSVKPAHEAFGTWRVLSLRIGYVALLLAVLVLLLGMRFGRDKLIARHRKLQETIGMSDVSRQMCEYQRPIMESRVLSPRITSPCRGFPAWGNIACRVPQTRWRNFGSPTTGRT